MITPIDYYRHQIVCNLGKHTLKSIDDVLIAYHDYTLDTSIDISCDWLLGVCNAFGYVFRIEDTFSKTVIDLELISPVIMSLFNFAENMNDTPT